LSYLVTPLSERVISMSRTLPGTISQKSALQPLSIAHYAASRLLSYLVTPLSKRVFSMSRTHSDSLTQLSYLVMPLSERVISMSRTHWDSLTQLSYFVTPLSERVISMSRTHWNSLTQLSYLAMLLSDESSSCHELFDSMSIRPCKIRVRKPYTWAKWLKFLCARLLPNLGDY